MSDKISVILVGMGGYANTYLNSMLNNLDEGEFTIPALVSSSMGENHPRLEEIRKRGIPIYRTLDELCANHRSDLAVISSPIHLHASHTCLALEHGMNVLCEKPTAGAIQDSERMKQARERAGRFVAIGYNLSFTDNIQELKKDIREGVFGKPLRFRTLCLWSRGEQYYRRNRWAGKMRAESGEWILDSPVHNATAHFLHNMLYLLGDRTDTSGRPVSVQAELYRANRIENYDTGALRVKIDRGVEILFFSTHAVEEKGCTVFEYEFDKGRVSFGFEGKKEIRAVMNDGTEKNYGTFQGDGPKVRRLWHCFDCVRTGTAPMCGLEAAEAQLISANGAQESAGAPADFPAEMVRRTEREEDVIHRVEGLEEAFRKCWTAGRLPSEIGFEWSRAGREIDLRDYREYPSGK